MSKFLIVEDEPSMRMGLKDNLEFEGYEVDLAEDGEAGLKMIRENHYDLIVLDVMMPKMSGFEVCKTIRKDGNKTPVILLTAKGEEIDKVLGLELGADDYVTKPFSLRELLARIKAVLRRSENISTGNESNDIVIGRITVNFNRYTARENNTEIPMSHKEFEVLQYLWNRKNSTVSRDDLLKDVWGQEVFTTTRTIDNFILKLRHKVEINSNHPKIILTVHGIGYKLVDV
ncbi:MAG: response regulator transcription factor [Melioribacteraceae bacterium]|nr:response regulator transcription factor [Melioribacteraceae bacterium]MCF8355920.1 response regulator transcription factor [Melioribacteraceae bacterium]MCF8395460.1 response regulator transcription factor [Melioribacteraceae bacterium]MCF8420786.1 response regulator transcription factor [Melioribacteraceae bacterium]